jgi:hypothetical protein
MHTRRSFFGSCFRAVATAAALAYCPKVLAAPKTVEDPNTLLPYETSFMVTNLVEGDTVRLLDANTGEEIYIGEPCKGWIYHCGKEQGTVYHDDYEVMVVIRNPSASVRTHWRDRWRSNLELDGAMQRSTVHTDDRYVSLPGPARASLTSTTKRKVFIESKMAH